MSEHSSTVPHRHFNLCFTFWVFYISFCLWEWHFLPFPFDIIVGVLCLTVLKRPIFTRASLVFECHYWEDEGDKYRISISFSHGSLESLNLGQLSAVGFLESMLCAFIKPRLLQCVSETVTGRALGNLSTIPSSLPFLGTPSSYWSGIQGRGREHKNNLSVE